MKKIISVLLSVLVLLSCVNVSFAEDAETFTYLKIPFPENIEDIQSWRTVARYKDTKEPIALSSAMGDFVYATVPVYNAQREIEAFVPENVEFTDHDDSMYEFFVMESLSKLGVIVGNEKGEAKPFDNVTRAEATAMILRLMGLDTKTEHVPSFYDVKPTDWFFDTVATANELGIVFGDSFEQFSPNRNVSREEVTVMLVRALDYADLRCQKRTVENIKDKDSISDWAKDAYEKIGDSYVSDYDDTDPENPIRVLNPQKSATRYDVCELLNNAQRSCQLYPSELAIEYGFDKKMPIIDGSTSTYPFTSSVYTKLFHNGPSHKMFPEKHSKSHASYERLINGEVDMLFASVYPASDILALAKEKGVELELIPIAYDAMIFFTNKDNPAVGITKEQIRDIYVDNAYKNWSEIGGEDSLIYAYCRNNDSGSHAQMERHFLGNKEIHPEVRKETSMTMSDILTDVMGAKTDDPVGYGLGYSIYYYFQNMNMFYDTNKYLKLLEVDGVYPSDETIADGSYPLSNNTYIVIRKDSPVDSPERKMAEFMLTQEGQVCVELAGYGRLK